MNRDRRQKVVQHLRSGQTWLVASILSCLLYTYGAIISFPLLNSARLHPLSTNQVQTVTSAAAILNLVLLLSYLVLPALAAAFARRYYFLYGVLPPVLNGTWALAVRAMLHDRQMLHQDFFVLPVYLLLSLLLSSGPVSFIRWCWESSRRRSAEAAALLVARQAAAAALPQEGVWPPPPAQQDDQSKPPV